VSPTGSTAVPSLTAKPIVDLGYTKNVPILSAAALTIPPCAANTCSPYSIGIILRLPGLFVHPCTRPATTVDR
jgi:hypothetical protein